MQRRGSARRRPAARPRRTGHDANAGKLRSVEADSGALASRFSAMLSVVGRRSGYSGYVDVVPAGRYASPIGVCRVRAFRREGQGTGCLRDAGPFARRSRRGIGAADCCTMPARDPDAKTLLSESRSLAAAHALAMESDAQAVLIGGPDPREVMFASTYVAGIICRRRLRVRYRHPTT